METMHENAGSDYEMREVALTYARRDWAVLPLYTARDGLCSCGNATCPSAGKHPRVKHGVKDATTDRATIEAWRQQWPDANIGIATGVVSGLVALDVDPRHGGQESLEALIQKHHGDFPQTVCNLTGGHGAHFLFFGSGGRHVCLLRHRRVHDEEAPEPNLPQPARRRFSCGAAPHSHAAFSGASCSGEPARLPDE